MEGRPLRGPPAPDEVSSEAMLRSLEGGQSSLSMIVKQVYDSGDSSKLMKQIDARIAVHNSELKRVADLHYAAFMEGIHDIVDIRERIIHLKTDVQKINGELKEDVQKAVAEVEQVSRLRRQQMNALQALEAIEQCIPALRLYCKLKTQLSEKKYYIALKTLEQLQHNYLPSIADFRFAQTLQLAIPAIRDDIRERSLNELPDFLMSVRSNANIVGQETMRKVALANKMDESLVSMGLVPPSGDGTYNSPADVIDYSTVYRCFHICEVLGYRDFGLKYHIQRTSQCKQTCNKPEILENLAAFRAFYCGVVGFFACESYLASKFPELVTEDNVKRLWLNEARQRVENTIRKGLEHSTKSSVMLDIKMATIIFAKSLQSFNLACQSFFNCLFELRDIYNQLLMSDFRLHIDRMVEEDSYAPLSVGTLDEYNDVTKKFPYHSDVLENAPFPRRFPFSKMVMELYGQVCDYMRACKAYIDDLGKSAINVEDTVCNCVNALTSHIIKRTFERMLGERKTLTLPQLVQIVVNLSCLEESCYHLEQFAASLVSGTGGNGQESSNSPHLGGGVTNSSGTGSASKVGSKRRQSLQVQAMSSKMAQPLVDQPRFRARLVAQTTFRDIGSHAEKKMRLMLNSKIDEFFSLSEYEWQLKASSGKPSQFVLEMLNFLTVNMQSIPAQISQTVVLEACRHIAMRLWEQLFDPETKQISEGAMEQFNLDVIQAEMFALSNPVVGLKDGALSQPFVKLRQLLELVLGQDWKGYLQSLQLQHNGNGNSTNSATEAYNELHPEEVLQVVDKLRDKKFFSVVGKKSEKSRELEQFASQLQHFTAAKPS